MKKINAEVIEEAKEFVTYFLTHKLSDNLLFHSINHTLEVFRNAEIIGSYCGLNGNDFNILRISALFHDVGYADVYDGHEFYSAQRAADFLGSRDIDAETIRQVDAAILATKMPQNPLDQISEILCDADLMYLTFDDYIEKIGLMRMEWEKIGKAIFNTNQFYVQSLEFFKLHQYHSVYGKKVLQPIKEKNELLIRQKVVIDD